MADEPRARSRLQRAERRGRQADQTRAPGADDRTADLTFSQTASPRCGAAANGGDSLAQRAVPTVLGEERTACATCSVTLVPPCRFASRIRPSLPTSTTVG